MRIITTNDEPTRTPREIAHDTVAAMLLATVPLIAMLCFGVDQKEIEWQRPQVEQTETKR